VLQRGIHPPKLWITLWVSRSKKPSTRIRSPFFTGCCFFKRKKIIHNQQLITLLKPCDGEMQPKAQCWRGCGLLLAGLIALAAQHDAFELKGRP
jgi:hypothetical protein